MLQLVRVSRKPLCLTRFTLLHTSSQSLVPLLNSHPRCCPMRPHSSCSMHPRLPAGAPASRCHPTLVLPLLLCVVLQPQLHIHIGEEPEAAAAPPTGPHVAALNQVVTTKHQALHSHPLKQGCTGEAVYDGHDCLSTTFRAGTADLVEVLLLELTAPAASRSNSRQTGLCWGVCAARRPLLPLWQYRLLLVALLARLHGRWSAAAATAAC